MLETSDLARFIESHQVLADILRLDVPTPTVEDAANAVGTSVEQIVKSLLFLVDGRPVVLITCGTGRVDRRPIAARFGVGRKRVKLADADTVLKNTGYPIGAMPPFGNLWDMPVYVAESLAEDEEIAFNAGSHTELIKMAYVDFERLVKPVVIKFSTVNHGVN